MQTFFFFFFFQAEDGIRDKLVTGVQTCALPISCGTNLQPCWSTVAFAIFGAPLAVGTETTALARPLLPPTTTFSITASVPHFSVSLLTLSFSTTGAPLYVTVTSTVPPPWASTGSGRWTNSATPATSAAARTTPSALRIALTPFLRPLASARTTGFSDSPRGARRRASAAAARLALPSSARLRASVRDANHEQHRREREDRHDRRNDETAARLRLLQPQIVPRGQRHLGPGLPRAAVPSLERDRQEDRRLERGPVGALGHERPLKDEPILAVRVRGLARHLAACERHDPGRPVRARLGPALAVLPPQQIHGVRVSAHEEVRAVRALRDLLGELERDDVGRGLLRGVRPRLRRVVPGHVEGDLLVVPRRPQRHHVDGGVEVPWVDGHLPHQGNVLGRHPLPELRDGIGRDVAVHCLGGQKRRVVGRLGPEGREVVRQVPDVVGLLHRVDERRHGRAQHAGREPHRDLRAAASAAEGPTLCQVRGPDRMSPLVLELGARRAVGPALGAVALVALDCLVHLLAPPDRLRGRGSRRSAPGPLPSPFSPWHSAHFLSYTALPAWASPACAPAGEALANRKTALASAPTRTIARISAPSPSAAAPGRSRRTDRR